MKKQIVLAVVLALMVIATAVFTITGENYPWESVNTKEPWDPDLCPNPSNPGVLESGVLYSNT